MLILVGLFNPEVNLCGGGIALIDTPKLTRVLKGSPLPARTNFNFYVQIKF